MAKLGGEHARRMPRYLALNLAGSPVYFEKPVKKKRYYEAGKGWQRKWQVWRSVDECAYKVERLKGGLA